MNAAAAAAAAVHSYVRHVAAVYCVLNVMLSFVRSLRRHRRGCGYMYYFKHSACLMYYVYLYVAARALRVCACDCGFDLIIQTVLIFQPVMKCRSVCVRACVYKLACVSAHISHTVLLRSTRY